MGIGEEGHEPVKQMLQLRGSAPLQHTTKGRARRHAVWQTTQTPLQSSAGIRGAPLFSSLSQGLSPTGASPRAVQLRASTPLLPPMPAALTSFRAAMRCGVYGLRGEQWTPAPPSDNANLQQHKAGTTGPRPLAAAHGPEERNVHTGRGWGWAPPRNSAHWQRHRGGREELRNLPPAAPPLPLSC